MGPALLIVLGQLAQPDPARALDLTAAAAASPRVPDCAVGGAQGRPGSALWQRAQAPELERYCDLLARGYAALENAPARAQASAQAAIRILPARPGALLLRARARTALGQFEQAYADFVRLGPVAGLGAPDALHDFALSALSTARYAEAAAAYRLLASRVSLLPSVAERQCIYVEAAVALMQLGAAGLDESIASLKEARQLAAPPGLSAHVAAALILALDRQGQTAQARGLAAEVRTWSALERALEEPGPPQTASDSRRRAWRRVWPKLPVSELHALLAVVLEAKDPAAAKEHWQAFLDQAAAHHSPWLEHARAKLAARDPGRGRKGR